MTTNNAMKPKLKIEKTGQLQGLQVAWRKPSDLIPWEGNPRTHGDKQIVALMASIKQLGFQVPIITNEEGVVLAGLSHPL